MITPAEQLSDQQEPCESQGPGQRGSLVVVGLGIGLAQLTIQAKSSLEKSDVVFCLTNNAASTRMLRELSPNVVDLQSTYALGKSRLRTYEEIVEIVLDQLRMGKKVCLAVYGHPGVFAHSTHAAIRMARSEGFHALMIPGVSALDCLFADLAIDPAVNGCQCFDASDFLLRERIWDPYSTLVLWQVSVAGITSLPEQGEIPPGHDFLKRKLVEAYGPQHRAVLYEASPYPVCAPRMDEVSIADLQPSLFRPHTTLVIPAMSPCPRRNEEFLKAIH